jgi:hypothetical protein
MGINFTKVNSTFYLKIKKIFKNEMKQSLAYGQWENKKRHVARQKSKSSKTCSFEQLNSQKNL